MYAGPLERYQMKQKEANWYGLEMLPKYLMMGKEQLHEAEKQLQMLKTCENRPYVLDDFFSLPLFNVLIRPCSNFSYVAGRLGDYLLEISPKEYRVVDGLVEITAVDVAGKGYCHV